MATNVSGLNRHHRLLRKRLGLWCAVFLLVFLAVFARFAWLQLVRGEHFRHEANALHTRKVTLKAIRGRMLDRNHTVLALDDRHRSLFVDPTGVPAGTAPFMAQQLAAVLQQPEAQITGILKKRFTSVMLTEHLPVSALADVRALGYPGLTIAARPQWHVTINPAELTQHPRGMRRLAHALHVPETDVRTLLIPEQALTQVHDEHEPASALATAPTAAVDWPDPIGDTGKAALAAEKLPGVRALPLPSTYALYIDPRRYNAKSAALVAQELAPLTNQQPAEIAERVTRRLRFAWLQRNLDQNTYAEVLRLQSTLFIVEPGKLLTENADSEAINDAVDQLYDLLNPVIATPKKSSAPRSWWQRMLDKRKSTPVKRLQRISKAEIREHLLGGEPGPLLYAPNTAGRPSLRIARALYADPIPGVIYGLPGVSIMDEPCRRYPYDTLSAATMGYLGEDEDGTTVGVFGLEKSQEPILGGKDGAEEKEVDIRGLTIPGRSVRREPVDGHDIILTLDVNIQAAAEKALAEGVEAHQALGGTCIVLEPNSGEILALATYPGWNANEPGKSTVTLANPAINNYYEPGSTFKLVPVMAALEEGVIHDSQRITTCTGSLGVGKRTVHEAHNAHGPVDCQRLLEQSCNIGAAVLSLNLGAKRYTGWVKKLGFGQRTGIELAQESPGTWNAEVSQARITLANMGFGQSIAVTPLQMAVAYGAAANGGAWVRPHLIKGRVRDDGTIEEVTAERRRVCSPETAHLLCSYLENVVVEGTGGNAKIPGYRVGGKTGTAQKPIPGIGFRSGKYIASFIGVMPIDKPQMVIIAVVDEPKGSIYGGSVAAPIVGAVGQRALQFLNIPPTEPVPAAKPVTP